MSDNCVFCREMEGSRDTNFASLYPEFDNRYLYRSSSLVAFPCIGQLTEGHFLIATNTHHTTFRKASISDPKILKDFHTVIKNVHEELGFNIEDSFIFEHGAISEDNGGCGIYHAHIHVVPNAKKVNPSDVFDFSNTIPSETIEAALMNAGEEQSYVLAANYDGGYFLSAINQPLPSQTLRRNTARVLGNEHWNWRETKREESMLKLLRTNIN